MKMFKKIAVLILTICMLVSCFSIISFAADGKIMFTDPSCKTGETVEIKGVVEKSRGNFGKIEITMTYDTTMMKFISGDGVTESQAGTITYQGDATRDVGTRKEFVLKFDALKAGSTTLKIQSATVKNVSGTVLDYTKGSSTISIAQGEETTVVPPTSSDATIEINGESYKFADEVPENEIPKGYESATLNYDLVDYNVVYSESTGLYVAYLVNESNIGSLFLYVEEDATFIPYEEIEISDNVTIVLLTDVKDVIMSNEYRETEVLLNDHAFPAWQDPNQPDYCIFYAINNRGEKSLYQLDNVDGTYQRFTAPEIVPEEKETWITKLSDVLVEHMDKVILGTGLGFLLFVLIIVILSVKLYNRNAELDITYEEYDEMKEKLARYEEDEDDEDEDYDTSSEEPSESAEGKEMEMLVQEGMKEVFPEEMMSEVLEEPEEEKEEKETSLAEALEQQKTMVEEMEADEEIEGPKSEGTGLFEDDEILMEDFSVDFIDLEDDDE